jgi:hypothetical protein
MIFFTGITPLPIDGIILTFSVESCQILFQQTKSPSPGGDGLL